MSIKLDIYKGTIRKDILLTLSSQIVIMCSALVVNKILSETMGVEGYGQYSIIKKSSAVLSFMMLGGMGITLPKFLSSYLAENDISRYLFTIKVAIKSVLVITLILLIIYILGQKYLIDSVIGDTNVFLYYIAFFYAFSVCISTLLFSYYRGSDLFVLFSLSQIINQLLLVGCVFLFENSVGTVFLSWAVCTTLFIIYSVFREKQKKIFQFVANGLANHGHCRLILTYSVPRLLGDILLFLFAAFPIIYIGNKLGIKYSGYFAVGVMFITIVSPLFSFLGTVLLPYVSRAIVKKEFVIANKIINKLLLLYIILSIIIVIIPAVVIVTAAAIMTVIITVIFYVITASTAIRAVTIAVVITLITITAPIFFLLWLRSFLISFSLLPIIKYTFISTNIDIKSSKFPTISVKYTNFGNK